MSDTANRDSFRLKDLRIRRCVGCVKCLTDAPERCAIDDGFSDIIPRILRSDSIVISFSPVDGRVPASVIKAVERISNILEAFTGSGGNVPVTDDSVVLRSVEFSIEGALKDGSFENDMRSFLLKGPVTETTFVYD